MRRLQKAVVGVLLVVAPITLAFASGSKVYKSVGEDGEVTFTDTPRPGAEKIVVPPANTISSPAPPPATADTKPQESKVFKYTSLTIGSPQNEQTFTDGSGDVPISVDLDPPLETRLGHRLELLVNGEAVGLQGNSTTMRNTNRGEHSVYARVVDRDGIQLISSERITFFVQRPNVFGPGLGGPGPGPGPGPGGP